MTPPLHPAPYPQWAAVADDADRFELALRLLAAVPAEQRGDDLEVFRARLLLLAGRPADGVAVLAATGRTCVPDTMSWPDAVLAGCLAATGNREAYRRLLAAAAATRGRDYHVTYLVAAAAEQLGDLATADRAWTSLVHDHRIGTHETLTHLVAARIAARDRTNEADTARAVVGAAANLALCEPPIDADPAPALAAAQLLERRGDVAGARLLLQAVVQEDPANAPVRQALARLTPDHAMRRYRLLRTVLSVLVAIPWLVAVQLSIALDWAVLALPASAIGYASRVLWYRRKRVPGLTAAESMLWRLLSRQHRPGDRRDQRGLYGLGAIAGLAVGAVVGSALTAGLERVAADATWTLLMVVFPVGGYIAARALHQWRGSRRRGRERASARHRRVHAARACMCWQTAYLVGETAAAYAAGHLVAGTLPDGAAIGECPSTGARWFGAPAYGPTATLLRAAVDSTETAAPVGQYL